MAGIKIAPALILAILTTTGLSDSLRGYTGDNCAGATTYSYEPIPNLECIDLAYGNAQAFSFGSFDDGFRYGGYADPGCTDFKGNFDFAGCRTVAVDAGGRRFMKREEDDIKEPEGPPTLGKRRLSGQSRLTKKQDDETYVRDNVPSGAEYFLLYTSSVGEGFETPDSDDASIESSFELAFNTTADSFQTVESTVTTPSGQTVRINLGMVNGVVGDIQDEDARELANTLLFGVYRQNYPLSMQVDLYTGRPDNPDSGIIGRMEFNLI